MHLLNLCALFLLPALSPGPPLFPLPTALVTAAVAPQEAPPDRFSAKVELSYASTTGNSSTQTIGTAGGFVFRPGVWSITTENAFLRTETDDRVRAESISSEARIARKVGTRMDAYTQASYTRNTFAGLLRQTAVELGLATQLLSSAPHRLRAEAAFGYIDEHRVAIDDQVVSTGTVGLRYRWTLSKNAEWAQDAVITANLTDGGDWRLKHSASIAAGLNAVFSLKFSHVLTYLHQPVPGFRQTDTIGSAALVARF